MSKKTKHHISESSKADSEAQVNLIGIIPNIKKHYPIILLVLFLLLGFYLRFYHIGYPVIGYHNWKTTHYITEARNFAREGFFRYGFFVPMRDTMEGVDEQPEGAHNDTFPADQIVVALFFRIFGESLVTARLVEIAFSLISVILFFLLIKELFDKIGLALLAAFLATISPLYVFFTHNIDVINSGLMFMILGAYFYVLWLKYQADNSKYSFLFVATFAVIFGTITKYSFAVIGIPIILTFPYKKFFAKKEKIIMPLLICLVIVSIFPAWFFYNDTYVKNNIYGKNLSKSAIQGNDLSTVIDLSVIWSGEFWNIMKSYIADNFTLLGMFFSLLGMVMLIFFFITKNRKKLGYQFMVGYIVALIAFVLIMGYKLSGHNYHQFPVAPLVVFTMAYFIDVLARNVSKLVKTENLRNLAYITVILIFLFVPMSQGQNNSLQSLYSLSGESKDRMYNTQFPGLDVAGDYIKSHSAPDERLYHSSGQSFGVLWSADRKGYKTPGTVEIFKKGEDKENVKWEFIYQWGLQSILGNKELFDYIKSNYRLVQAAFIPVSEQQNQLLYLLLRKGGSFNESELNNIIQKAAQEGRMYNQNYFYTFSPYQIRYVNIE